MNDDHDRCEWVNVSSGTGSPGFKTQSCRMVARVCNIILITPACKVRRQCR